MWRVIPAGDEVYSISVDGEVRRNDTHKILGWNVRGAGPLTVNLYLYDEQRSMAFRVDDLLASVGFPPLVSPERLPRRCRARRDARNGGTEHARE